MLIYKATSKTTGKIYIGQTSQSLQKRINQHKCHSKNKNYHFYNAIEKYGFDDFMFEVIEDNIKTQEELNNREIYWIQYYNSYYDGYNSTLGGDGNVRRKEDLVLELFNKNKTTQEISNITGHNRSTIYDILSANNLSEELHRRKNKATQERCSEKVLQYDLKGNFIKEWSSASEAGRYFGSQGLISALCRQDTSILSAYNFLFKYKNDSRDIKEWVDRFNNKKEKPREKILLQINDNGEIIKEYRSATEAAKVLNKNSKSYLCTAARKKGKAYGYYWQYKE